MTRERPERSRRTMRLVARREVRERLRARSFWLLTALLVGAILAMSIITRLADSSDDEVRVGVVSTEAAGSPAADRADGSTATLAASLRAAARRSGLRARVTDDEDRRTAERWLRAGDVDVVVDPGRGEVVFDGSVDDERRTLVDAAWAATTMRAALAADGLDEASIERALSPDRLDPVTIDDDSVPPIAYLVGTVAAIMLFFALQTFGSYVLMGVVEEKSTAVIEVLLARAAPDQLLAGKVTGIGLCAAVQMVAAVGAGLVALAVSGRSVPSDIWSAVPMLLVWFIGGYALYSTLFALAGSLVSRQEDAQAASAPIMAALLAAYLTVFTFGYAPHSTISTVLSVLPPTAPLLMPMRMAAGAASVPEVVLAVVLLIASIFLAWKVTGRIYGAVVLQRGTRITWRSALAAGRARP